MPFQGCFSPYPTFCYFFVVSKVMSEKKASFIQDELSGKRDIFHARHTPFHIHRGGYPGFEDKCFEPRVSLLTTIPSCLDISQALLYWPILLIRQIIMSIQCHVRHRPHLLYLLHRAVVIFDAPEPLLEKCMYKTRLAWLRFDEILYSGHGSHHKYSFSLVVNVTRVFLSYIRVMSTQCDKYRTVLS